MERLDLTFFPYPTVHNGTRRQGFSETSPKQCDHCDRQCEKAIDTGINTCSYGVNYQLIDTGLLVFGVLVRSPHPSSATKKLLRDRTRKQVDRVTFEKVISGLAAADRNETSKVESEKQRIIDLYVKDNKYKVDYLELLKPTIQRNLAFLHDYSQFVSSVKQNINVVLHTRYLGGDIEAKLERASEQEKAIYWGSSLMSEKLSTASLLLHPERIATGEKTVFKLHGLILKYIRIYNAAYQAKQVRLDVTGNSFGLVRADSAVLSVIPHTLLDNALKYSRAGARVVAVFTESLSAITFSVTSFGPKIDPDERERIFDIFYRGRHAQAQEDGSGFGLHLAQFIARQLGTTIQMNQSMQSSQYGFETTFSVVFSREQ